MDVFYSNKAAVCRPDSCGSAQCFLRTPKDGTYNIHSSAGVSNARCEFDRTSVPPKPPKLVFLRREGSSLDFHARKWIDYVNGFNDSSGRFMWLGLENAHRVTKDAAMVLTVKLTSTTNKVGVVRYNDFVVHSKVLQYSVSYGHVMFSRKTGNSFPQRWPFSSPDHDKTRTLCASKLNTGGWFNPNKSVDTVATRCVNANLFGRFTGQKGSDQEVSWRSFNRRVRSIEMILTTATRPCVNPCQHDGLCHYNAQNDVDNCSCVDVYFGYTCEC
ncbi:hypothetical protein LSAT2_004867 [Lamellibrachia satsuma]|nr:hypothetical protein LSAT2_004867 [Lamellibrachia satsuma]